MSTKKLDVFCICQYHGAMLCLIHVNDMILYKLSYLSSIFFDMAFIKIVPVAIVTLYAYYSCKNIPVFSYLVLFS